MKNLKKIKIFSTVIFLAFCFLVSLKNCEARSLFLVGDSIMANWYTAMRDDATIPNNYDILPNPNLGAYWGTNLYNWRNDNTFRIGVSENHPIIVGVGYSYINQPENDDFFISLGVNDMWYFWEGATNTGENSTFYNNQDYANIDKIVERYGEFFDKIKSDKPNSKIFFASVYPMRDEDVGSFNQGEINCNCFGSGAFDGSSCEDWESDHPSGPSAIDCSNFLNTNYQVFLEKMRVLTAQKGVVLIDPWQKIVDHYNGVGNLDPFYEEYFTNDGVHMNEGALYYTTYLRPAFEESLILPTISKSSDKDLISHNKKKTILSVTTSKDSTCKYSDEEGASYLSMEDTFDTTGGTSHETKVSVKNNKDYEYYVQCMDENNNITDEVKFSFSKELSISNIKANSTNTSITIKWETNNEADSEIKYGTTKSLNQKISKNKKEQRHEIIINDLIPNQTYYFQIISKDQFDDQEKSKVYKIFTRSESLVNSSNGKNLIKNPILSLFSKFQNQESEEKNANFKNNKESQNLIPDFLKEDINKDKKETVPTNSSNKNEAPSFFSKIFNFFRSIFR